MIFSIINNLSSVYRAYGQNLSPATANKHGRQLQLEHYDLLGQTNVTVGTLHEVEVKIKTLEASPLPDHSQIAKLSEQLDPLKNRVRYLEGRIDNVLAKRQEHSRNYPDVPAGNQRVPTRLKDQVPQVVKDSKLYWESRLPTPPSHVHVPVDEVVNAPVKAPVKAPEQTLTTHNSNSRMETVTQYFSNRLIWPFRTLGRYLPNWLRWPGTPHVPNISRAPGSGTSSVTGTVAQNVTNLPVTPYISPNSSNLAVWVIEFISRLTGR